MYEMKYGVNNAINYMEDATHGLLESKAEEFSGVLHQIVQIEHCNSSSHTVRFG